MMIYGYARVSTADQKLDMQLDALKAARCDKIYKEKISAAKERPELAKVLKIVKRGDVLVVWKLDRLGRSLRHLIDTVNALEDAGVKFISLNDNINTQTAQGRLIFNIFASLAEFERDIIRERTNAGLTAARARGRKGGRPAGLSTETQLKVRYAKELYENKEIPVSSICKKLSISRKTLYRWLKTETPDVTA